MMTVRGFDPGDLPALLALQHAEAGTAPRLTLAELRTALQDAARGHGAQVRVAHVGGLVVGAAGWVVGPGAMFATPFMTGAGPHARAAAERLLAELRAVQAAAGAPWIRTSTGDPSSARAAALAAAGFTPQFEFLDLSRATTPAPAPTAPPPDLHLVAAGALDRERLRALENETFADVPNALPMSAAQIDEALDEPGAFSAGTGALVDERGEYVAFLRAQRQADADGVEHAVVDAVGVAAAARGRGLGRVLVERMLAAAAAAGIPRAGAIIASTNPASLALHQALGFTVRHRRQVWQGGDHPAR